MSDATISVVIPTFGRDEVLTDTISALLSLDCGADEIVVVDQTMEHASPASSLLNRWSVDGAIRWLRVSPPGTVGAMNRGLRESQSEIVLFIDDDIVPGPSLVERHRRAHAEHTEAWAVVGQVLQPEDCAPHRPGDLASTAHKMSEPPHRPVGHRTHLMEDLQFPFNSSSVAWVTNVMAGNLSVKRDRALGLGGFDANFIGPVSYRFETEFAKRLVTAGGCILFEPRASIRHLRAEKGGTRSRGSHLTSASPVHGVGDYYYALQCGRGLARWSYILRRPFREVRTRFHLRHPWWIPVKLIGELRALAWGLRLHRQGPRYLSVKRNQF